MNHSEQLAASRGALPPRSTPGPSCPRPACESAAQVLRVLAWLAALGTAMIGVALIMPTLMPSGPASYVDLALLFMGSAVVAAALFQVARGLVSGRHWARIAGVVCALMMLIGFPLGTIAGTYLLWKLLPGWTTPQADASDG